MAIEKNVSFHSVPKLKAIATPRNQPSIGKETALIISLIRFFTQ